MSALQFEEISNETSITQHNDRTDSKLSRLLLRQNKAIMKMARNRAWRMAIMRQTPFEKELPKAWREILSKLSVELRKRTQNGDRAQIKLERVQNIDTRFNIGEAGESTVKTELSPEIKFILRFRRDISVEQALIKQRLLIELKERSVKRNAGNKQSYELPKTKTEEIKSVYSNNENISQNMKAEEVKTEASNNISENCNNSKEIEKDISKEQPRYQPHISTEQALIREKLMAELKERSAKMDEKI
nr:uncharacterized protein LOC118681415 [Bactrocera oleae]